MKGEWNMCIGSVEQGKRNMESDVRKWLLQYFRLFLSKKLKGFSLSWRTPNCILLYRYWWNTRIFYFTKKSYLHLAQWRYYFYLSYVRIVVSPWLLTWLANYKRASRSGRFFCCYRIFPFFIRILTFWNRKYKCYCLYFSFITLYPSFITFLWQAFCDRWPL